MTVVISGRRGDQPGDPKYSNLMDEAYQTGKLRTPTIEDAFGIVEDTVRYYLECNDPDESTSLNVDRSQHVLFLTDKDSGQKYEVRVRRI